MTDTLIDVINDVLTDTHQRAGKTAIASTDSTAFIRNRINDALSNLYKLKPFLIDSDGSVTITPSTRTFSGPSATELQNIRPWSLRINRTGGDIPVDYVTEQYIVDNYPDFETAEALYPQYAYYTKGLIGIYPLLKAGQSSLTLQFIYATQFTKLTSTSATFPFADGSDEMRYIKLFAKLKYEIEKGLGQPGVTNEEMTDVYARIKAKYAKGKRIGFVGSRFYGR